ncbi:MAG: pyrroline-5-carboxylate reductase [Rhodobacteraceae bacterium]|nr:pyrroline-5-carboxylate reductase [Paracoccaceae bacterium]
MTSETIMSKAELRYLCAQGLLLLGCGKMGAALLRGWLDRGLPAEAVFLREPRPSPWVQSLGIRLNAELPRAPALVVVALKPQTMTQGLAELTALGNGQTLFVSIAAGLPLSFYEAALGRRTPIIRAMPNTPVSVGKAITAMIGNARVAAAQLRLAEELLSAVGQVVVLDTEAQMDAITAVSGSGPAYVFYLIECLAAAARAQGLPAEMAMTLARATVAGAGALAEARDQSPNQLRNDVTSPGGTTEAALKVLTDADRGLQPLMEATVAAAVRRSQALGKPREENTAHEP